MVVIQLYSVGRQEFGIIAFYPWLSRFQGIYITSINIYQLFPKEVFYSGSHNDISNKIGVATLDLFATK